MQRIDRTLALEMGRIGPFRCGFRIDRPRIRAILLRSRIVPLIMRLPKPKWLVLLNNFGPGGISVIISIGYPPARLCPKNDLTKYLSRGTDFGPKTGKNGLISVVFVVPAWKSLQNESIWGKNR